MVGQYRQFTTVNRISKTMMCSKLAVLAVLSVTCLVHGGEVPKDKRQVGSAVIHNKDDHEASETGFHEGHHHHGSKYFQYIHNPVKDHYEHGHKRGNEHHFIERHEKAHPHAGEFKTKVRWGDKHGGYGEHYWDYNHAGHGHDGSGEESQRNEEYAQYEQESKQVPKYAEQLRGKREPTAKQDVEFIDDKAKSLHYSGRMPKHGGNYRTAPEFGRAKREHGAINSNNLVYETDLGVIIDQTTGQKYELKPVN